MSEEVDALRSEVADLRAELAEAAAARQGAVGRRRLLAGLATAGAATVLAAKPAGAADGDPLLLGTSNDATDATLLLATFAGSLSEVVLASEAWGVMATAEFIGVLGTVGAGGEAGVWGEVSGPGGSGVVGSAIDPAAVGVTARSATGPALAASSDQDGVTLELTPAARVGPPTTMPQGLGEYRAGSVSVDQAGEVWLCVGAGAPGTWTRLLREDTGAGRTVPIPPTRVLDTRAPGGRPSGAPAVPGQVAGRRPGGSTTTLDLRGAGPIPSSANGVVGNLTVASPSYGGYLAVGPAGVATATSALNFTRGAIAANAFTSQINEGGLAIRGSGSPANAYHLIVDVTAYIT